MCWISATVKRVVRSTLPAAAYGVSEAAETRELLRRLIENLLSADGNLNKVENSALRRPLHVVTDNLNLCLAVLRDKSSTADKRLPSVVAMLRQLCTKKNVAHAVVVSYESHIGGWADQARGLNNQAYEPQGTLRKGAWGLLIEAAAVAAAVAAFVTTSADGRQAPKWLLRARLHVANAVSSSASEASSATCIDAGSFAFGFVLGLITAPVCPIGAALLFAGPRLCRQPSSRRRSSRRTSMCQTEA